MNLMENKELAAYITNHLEEKKYKHINKLKLQRTILKYNRLLNKIKNNSAYGYFNSYDQGACVILAIASSKLMQANDHNLSVGIDIALDMCTNPKTYDKNGFKLNNEEEVSYDYILDDPSREFNLKYKLYNYIHSYHGCELSLCQGLSIMLGFMYNNALEHKKLQKEQEKIKQYQSI